VPTFRSLKKLDLAICPPLRATALSQHVHWGPEVAGCLPQLLKSMPDLEMLALSEQPHFVHDGFELELNCILGIGEVKVPHSMLSNVVSPPGIDQYAVGQHQVLCVWGMPVYPKLRHLDLRGFKARSGGLISLLRSVNPTLETLVLHRISLERDLYTWMRVLDAMRKIFSRKSPPLDLLLEFPEREYLELLVYFGMVPRGDMPDEAKKEVWRTGVRKIARYVTTVAEEIKPISIVSFVPMMA
jgi:hypothetical protein